MACLNTCVAAAAAVLHTGTGTLHWCAGDSDTDVGREAITRPWCWTWRHTCLKAARTNMVLVLALSLSMHVFTQTGKLA